MNFPENSGIQISLPQFSELTRSNSLSTSEFNSSPIQLQTSQNSVYTMATGSHQGKTQIQINSPNKYPSSLLSWPDPSTLMQLCERQGIQTINIPNYNQNNSGILGVQSNSLPLRLIPNMYLPSTSQVETEKEDKVGCDETKNGAFQQESQIQLQPQAIAMTEYIQKLQATTLPLTLQQLIKMQTGHIKKEKPEGEKIEHAQANNILNIPSVPAFRNFQSQNGGFAAEHMMVAINPSDMNLHLENNQESNAHGIKVEQQVQTDSPKAEKKMKFRAKTGEIKISVALDGSRVFCCPECNLVFPEKTEIDQHIQAHIQERKYQCKECGAMLKRKEHLDQHMRGHSDERPYKCPVCQKAFKRNEHLTRHYGIHSGDKNFSCTVCQKAFSRKDHLNKHMQTHLGIRKMKIKKDSFFIDQRESCDKSMDSSLISKQEVNLLQHFQNLQKDQSLWHSLSSSFKEQSIKEGNLLSQQVVNMNDILPQNTRYLMPS